jgi:hypothetical protein
MGAKHEVIMEADDLRAVGLLPVFRFGRVIRWWGRWYIRRLAQHRTARD